MERHGVGERQPVLNVVGRIDDLIGTARVDPERDLRGELELLVSATMKQIVAEERFMELAGFPQVKQHRIEHLSLWEGATKLRFLSEKAEVQGDLYRLRRFWLEHMRVHDRVFERFLNVCRG